MMIKKRQKPNILRMLETLDARMQLPVDKRRYMKDQQRGYRGELKLDYLLQRLSDKHILVQDLCLELGHSLFQMDALVITGGRIWVYEVKNYRGRFVYANGKMVKQPNLEIDNPFEQLERCVRRLQRLLSFWGVDMPVEGKVVFIDPTFFLYQAPVDQGLLFAAELPAHITEIEQCALPADDSSLALAKKLVSRHVDFVPYAALPKYDFASLKKGLACPHCLRLTMAVQKRTCVCLKCGWKENFSSAVERHAEEVRLLFPGEPLTADLVYEWCGGLIAKRSVGRHLKSCFERSGFGRGTAFK